MTFLSSNHSLQIMCNHQQQFFRGGKGGQASLTFYQSTNKIIAVFIADIMSYMKMSRLIKQEKFFVSLLLSANNRKCYRYRTDKELVVIELINRWRCCLKVDNRDKILLGYHGNDCSTNKEAGLFYLYIQYGSYVRRPVRLIPNCKELLWKETFCVRIVQELFWGIRWHKNGSQHRLVYQLKRGSPKN